MNDEIKQLGFIDDCIRYMVICGVLALVAVIYNAFAGKESYGFWGSIAIFVFYTILPAIGAAIGNWLRKIAMPMFIVTSGGMGGLLKAKTFWAVGPQIIGWIGGAVIAIDLLNKWFGFNLR